MPGVLLGLVAGLEELLLRYVKLRHQLAQELVHDLFELLKNKKKKWIHIHRE
jgi:hypothetical protein